VADSPLSYFGAGQPARMHKAKFVSAPPVGAIAHPGRQSQQQKQQQQSRANVRPGGPKVIRLRQGPRPETVPSMNDYAVRPACACVQ
jgi:hypothetical protein